MKAKQTLTSHHASAVSPAHLLCVTSSFAGETAFCLSHHAAQSGTSGDFNGILSELEDKPAGRIAAAESLVKSVDLVTAI